MPESPKPSVVVITCHDLGRHLGCYGVPTVASPNIDAFAASAIVFDNAFSTAPQCSQARATLATGLLPHSTGLSGTIVSPRTAALRTGGTDVAGDGLTCG